MLAAAGGFSRICGDGFTIRVVQIAVFNTHDNSISGGMRYPGLMGVVHPLVSDGLYRTDSAYGRRSQ